MKFLTIFVALVLCGSTAFAQSTLYAELGGNSGLTKIVADAIKRWEQNPALAEQFKNADTERLEKCWCSSFVRSRAAVANTKGAI